MRLYRWSFALALLYAVGSTAAAPNFEPPQNEARSLRVAYLRYLADSAEPLLALAYQRRLPASALSGGDSIDLQIQLARQLAHYGLLARAGEHYRQYLSASYDNAERNRLWFGLAQAWYARGNYRQAQAALGRIYGVLPAELQGQDAPLQARTLIAQGRYDDAVKELRKWRERSKGEEHDPYARYNLGVAMIRAGRRREGAGELNKIGTMKAETPEALALRDKANLVLAFGYLEIGQGATARALFQRIRLDGPFSDKALLGLGWAEIAPDGEIQKRVTSKPIHCIEDPARLLRNSSLPVLRRMPREACGPPKRFKSTQEFKTKEGGATEAERYRRALVPWLELVKRNPAQAAVEEALVAVPYAYTKLGADARADEFYDHAVQTLTPQHEQVIRVIHRLQSPAAEDAAPPPGVDPDLDWFARRWGFGETGDIEFLADTVSEPHFRQAARSLQDLVALRDRLTTDRGDAESLQSLLTGRRMALLRGRGSLPDAFLRQQEHLDTLKQHLDELDNRLRSAIAEQSRFLRSQALQVARERRRHLETYLANARLGRARLLNADNGGSP